MAFFWKRKSGNKKGLIAIEFQEDAMAISVSHSLYYREPDFSSNQASLVPKKAIDQVAVIPFSDYEDKVKKLKEYVIANNLENMDCAIVLSSKDYRLLLLDTPNVPPKELNQATKWLIKDLIDFSIEAAVIDLFAVPVRSGHAPQMYAVVTKQAVLQEIMQILREAGLLVRSIDITELALRNMMARLPQSENGVMYLARRGSAIHLLITRGSTLYFERMIDVPQNESNASLDSALADEIQRSLEFYQNQKGQEPPAYCYLDPAFKREDNLLQQLKNNLTMAVEVLDLNTIVQSPMALDDTLQSQCVVVIGELMGFPMIGAAHE